MIRPQLAAGPIGGGVSVSVVDLGGPGPTGRLGDYKRSVCGRACPHCYVAGHTWASLWRGADEAPVATLEQVTECITQGWAPRAVVDCGGGLAVYVRAGGNAKVAGVARIGESGDPGVSRRTAEACAAIAQACHAAGVTVTGYTHQWHRAWSRVLQPWSMASCESDRHARDAIASGWRAYRVIPADCAPPDGAAYCPGQCLGCPIPCNGQGGPAIVYQRAHGILAGRLPKAARPRKSIF